MENMLGDYTNILVAVDGSEQSEHSFKKAVAIAQRNKAKLKAVFIMDTRNVATSSQFTSGINQDFFNDVDTSFVDELVRFAKDAGVDADKTITNGNPMTLIAEAFPKEFGSDLIVIGATGKGAITRALVGSVSNYVVKHAPCDVLVVR